MTEATLFLKEYEWISDMFISFSRNPLLGVLAGFLLTVLIQSSSVTIGILIALSVSGFISLEAAIPIIFGDNIGTCVTALLSSMGSNFQAKRAALAHLIFNVMGTIVGLILLPLYLMLIPHTALSLARQIANAHTLFNIINVALFLPFIPLFVKILKKIIPSKPQEERGTIFINRELLSTPSIAIDLSIKEILRMLEIDSKMIGLVMDDFFKGKIESIDKVMRMEDMVDELRREITKYLIEITEQELSDKDSTEIPALLHIVNDLKRIAGHAVNLAELTERKISEKTVFSKDAEKELRHVYGIIVDMINGVDKALKHDKGDIAEKIYEIENLVNNLTMKYRNNHIERLRDKRCKLNSGVLFVDFLMNFEKVGNHLVNILDAKLGVLSGKK